MEQKNPFDPNISSLEVTEVRRLKLGDRACGSTVFRIGKENGRGSTVVYFCDFAELGCCSTCIKNQPPIRCPIVASKLKST